MLLRSLRWGCIGTSTSVKCLCQRARDRTGNAFGWLFVFHMTHLFYFSFRFKGLTLMILQPRAPGIWRSLLCFKRWRMRNESEAAKNQVSAQIMLMHLLHVEWVYYQRVFTRMWMLTRSMVHIVQCSRFFSCGKTARQRRIMLAALAGRFPRSRNAFSQTTIFAQRDHILFLFA